MQSRLCLTTISLLTLFVFPAAGQSMRKSAPSTWYAGATYDRYSTTGQNIDGFGGLIGWRPSRYLALEAAGQFGSVSGVDLTNGYFQALFTMPIGQHLDLYLAGGGAFANQSVSSGPVTVSYSGGGYRLGGGANVWLNQKWGIRLSFNRQNATAVADDYGVGLLVRF